MIRAKHVAKTEGGGGSAPPRRIKRETFADRLVRLRAERGLTGYALARLLGSHRSQIVRIERGQQPSFGLAVRIAAALGVGVEAFADCVENLEGGSSVSARNGR